MNKKLSKRSGYQLGTFLALALAVPGAAQAAEPGWSPAETISAPAEIRPDHLPGFESVRLFHQHAEIAIDDAGNALAAWLHFEGQGAQARNSISAATRAPDGRWSAPENLTEHPQAGPPAPSFGEAGEAVLEWSRTDETGYIFEEMRRPAGGAWSPITRVPRPPLPSSSVTTAADEEIEVWGEGSQWSLAPEDDLRVIRVRVRQKEGEWGPTETISRSGDFTNLHFDRPADGLHRLAVSAAGDAMIVWDTNQGSRTVTRPAGGAWSEPEAASHPGFGHQSGFSELRLNRAGDAVAVWTLPSTFHWRIFAAVKPAGGPWSAPQPLTGLFSKLSVMSVYTDVELNEAGDAAVAFHTNEAGVVRAQVAVRPGGAPAWSAPETLSSPEHHGLAPRVDLGEHGQAVVVWTEDRGTDTVVRASSNPDLSPGWPRAGEEQSAPETIPEASQPSGPGSGDRAASDAGGGSEAGQVELSAAQMLINQRIAQAAVRRVNAIRAELDGQPAPAVRTASRGQVELSAAQMLINQRIAQAAVRRVNAIRAELEGKRAERPDDDDRTTTQVELTATQMLINQRIAQTALRRANDLQAEVRF